MRFDASDLMPGEVGSGSFWKEGTNYVSGTEDVDEFLDERPGLLADELTS